MFLVNSKKLLFVVAIALLLLALVWLGVTYSLKAKELSELRDKVTVHGTNKKVTIFLQLFIQKVLRSDGVVSFEDRLRLENAVRDINDPLILEQWERFTQADTEPVIQEEVKNLLEALIEKIST